MTLLRTKKDFWGVICTQVGKDYLQVIFSRDF